MSIEVQMRELGLRKLHIKLVNFFLAHLNTEHTALEIAKTANIPVTRVYKFLDDLVASGLIEKRMGSCVMFIMSDPETKFRNFLYNKNREWQEIGKSVIDHVTQSVSQENNNIPLQSGEDFYLAAYQVTQKANVMKIFSRSNLLVLPHREQIYWRDQFIKAMKDKIKAGVPAYYLIETASLKKKINKRNTEAVQKNILWLVSHGVRLVDVNTRNMISMIITDKAAVVGFRYHTEHITTKGLLLCAKELVRLFDAYYDDVVAKGKEININKLTFLFGKDLVNNKIHASKEYPFVKR